MLIPALCGLYKSDNKDTEEAYRNNIAQISFENTIETADPQTDLYNIIANHFNSDLPEGKTEKKAIIIGYDGCRADILAIKSEENSAISTLLAEGASINLAYCGGVNYPAENTQATSTAPGWCSMLTGVWSDVHGINWNGQIKTVEPKMLMTTLIEENVIDSQNYESVYLEKQSRFSFPHDISIQNNTFYSTANEAIYIDSACTGIVKNNTIIGTYGVPIIDNDDTHLINENNFDSYFSFGSFNSRIKENYTRE